MTVRGTERPARGGLFANRTFATLVMLFAIGAVAVAWKAWSMQSELVRRAAIDGAEIVAMTVKEMRSVYSSEVVARVGEHLHVTHDYESRDDAIPLPATLTFELGERLSATRLGARSRLFSPYPFPWRASSGGLSDDFTREAWQALTANPGEPFYRLEEIDGRPLVRYARAEVMGVSCVACHNTHEESPKRDWQVGDIRGGLEITLPLDGVYAEAAAASEELTVFLGLIAVTFALGAGIALQRLRRGSERLEDRVDERTRELRKSQERTRLVTQEALDAIVVMNESGSIEEWNPKATEVFGWSADEATGRKVAQLLVPERYRADHCEGIVRYLTTGEGEILGKRIETLSMHRDGHEVPIELTIVPAVVDGRRLFTAFITDITERHRVASELHASKNAAEAANRAKTEFLANMSHELRTPLHGILSFANFGRKKSADNETLHLYFDRIRTSGKTLLTLLDDVLDLAKLEAAKMEVDLANVSVGRLVRAVISEFEATDAIVNLRMSGEADDTVAVDDMRIRQVLRNVLSNAHKFSDASSPIEVIVEVGPEKVLIGVADRGVGIPGEELETIFDKFVQSSTTRSGAGGTGLGLAICREIVQLHQGRMWAESRLGGGATFWFELPRQLQAAGVGV